MGNFEQFHFSTLIFNNLQEMYFWWLSFCGLVMLLILWIVLCVGVFDSDIDFKIQNSTLFFSANLQKIRYKYLTCTMITHCSSNHLNLEMEAKQNLWWKSCYIYLNLKYLSAIALLYPPFLLMILVQNFMLIKNHIETWVWKSTEMKLFTVKVL